MNPRLNRNLVSKSTKAKYYTQMCEVILKSFQLGLEHIIVEISKHNLIISKLAIKMTDHESLRNTILQDSDLMGSKRRFGLFSQPISTAIGDDGAFKTKIHPKNEMGKPVTLPRSIYVSPIRSGQLRSSSFGPLNSLATHERRDIFLEEGIRLLKQQNSSFNSGRQETSFFPIAGIKPITNSAYPYIDQKNPELDPKRHRAEDGRVKSQPRNFYTNPQTRVIDTSFKDYKYIEDPYERKHQQDLQYMKKQKEKEQETNFRPNNFAPATFNKPKLVYGLDRQITKSPPKQPSFNIYKHQAPWKSSNPTKQSFEGLFEPVPKYVQNPPPIRKRIHLQKSEKDAFKSMNSSVLATPSPSISLNRVNMMRSINRSFSPKR